jgi:hypothetical protein
MLAIFVALALKHTIYSWNIADITCKFGKKIYPLQCWFAHPPVLLSYKTVSFVHVRGPLTNE